MNKKILFLTGTRADFGKLKSLIKEVEQTDGLEAYVFVTGMHMLAKYGMTAIEVEKSSFKSIYKYINQNSNDSMDIILAKTINGLSDYVKEIKPDMIVVHGDRVEALAGSIVGSLNNILVSHIEGGEVSGTIDELIRHSISKMAHLHFVCNENAKSRLIQLGEDKSSVFIIGSPDLDIMTSKKLPTIEAVKERYDIFYEKYSILMYHPVTTELETLPQNIKETIDAIIDSGDNYIVVYPNNDHGTDVILNELLRLENNPRFKIFPSIRFEFFLVLLKNAEYIIGNSSAGVREAPFYGLPSINLGNRQNNRATANSIINVNEQRNDILISISEAKNKKHLPIKEFGDGNSCQLFIKAMLMASTWATNKQKIFVDM